MASPRLSLWYFLILWLASSCICTPKCAAQEATTAAAAAAAATSDVASLDLEDELVQETIAAGRGDRDEPGVRDQWESEEHLGRESTFDSRRPMSEDVKRLLKAYRLTCEGCDHNQAVRKVNNYIQEAKRIVTEEQEARERRDSVARTLFGLFVVAVLSAAYMYQKELGLDMLLRNGKPSSDEFAGFSEAQKANILRLRRQHAADAAAKRQQEQANPTWLQNEKKEVWTPKQEKQFQKALRELSGVPKKERYKLIAEKVQGKSRIECLTHHRMQELLAKRQQEQSQ